MISLLGTVYRVIYQSPQNNYCVFIIRDFQGEDHPCVSYMEAPRLGDEIEVKGTKTVHKKYGAQLKVQSMQKIMPDTVAGAKRYITNLHIKGLGPKTLEKVVAYFGDTLVQILKEDNPVRILEIPNVGKKTKEELYRTLLGEGALREINEFFESHQMSNRWSRKLYEVYGAKAVEVLRENPYVLLRLDESMPFSLVDTFAHSLDIAPHNTYRIDAGVRYMVGQITEYGHTCMPMEELMAALVHLLGDEQVDAIVDRLEYLIDGHWLVQEHHEYTDFIYRQDVYRSEVDSVEMTKDFLERETSPALDTEYFCSTYESSQQFTLGDEQKQAITMALQEPFSIITGGPGTGKTTIIQALVEGFQKVGKQKIILCAPTGRAAKRLSEATHYEAFTIHRLLEPESTAEGYIFSRNEDMPLEADVVIVDETSMVNLELYYALLQAIPSHAHIVLVGDVDQLPPIGAGSILQDLLHSDRVPYQELTQIYRQQEGHQIIENAYAINQGQMPDLSLSEEFHFQEVHHVEALLDGVRHFYEKELQAVSSILDVQIICPMRKGPVGSTAISKYLQDVLNPKEKEKAQVVVDGTTFRIGDKVIQMENNYEQDVYNGEIGIIISIVGKDVHIRFPDKDVVMDEEGMLTMALAYAITVHKAQGSEYSRIILPFISAYNVMLQRNLLYTAITRAKEKVVIIGSERAIQTAIQRQDSQNRYSLFKERLKGDV